MHLAEVDNPERTAEDIFTQVQQLEEQLLLLAINCGYNKEAPSPFVFLTPHPNHIENELYWLPHKGRGTLIAAYNVWRHAQSKAFQGDIKGAWNILMNKIPINEYIITISREHESSFRINLVTESFAVDLESEHGHKVTYRGYIEQDCGVSGFRVIHNSGSTSVLDDINSLHVATTLVANLVAKTIPPS